jgi:hypothetical protein
MGTIMSMLHILKIVLTIKESNICKNVKPSALLSESQHPHLFLAINEGEVSGI